MKRNYLRIFGGVAIAAIVATTAAACKTETPSTPAKCGGKLATFGAFSGGDSGLVLPSLDGIKLAVKQHNAKNKDCQVTLEQFDTEGSGDKATPAAGRIAADATFLGVLGGHFSGESRATMGAFEAAGIAMVAPSATAEDLTAKGNKVFHRVVGNDATQGKGAAVMFKTVLKSTKVFVIDDGTTYGKGIADTVKKELGAMVVDSDIVKKGQTDFKATVAKIKAKDADGIFYAGYTTEGSLFLKQARNAGITAKFLGPDGLVDPNFVTGAGPGGEGAVLTCPCLPAKAYAGSFSADFKTEYGREPGAYSGEGYDAATIFLKAFLAGKSDRKSILEFVNAYDQPGISKHLKFNKAGDVDESKVVIWAYEIKGGQIVPLQEVPRS